MMPRLYHVVAVLALLAMACNLPGSSPTTPTGSSALITEVAGTLAALQAVTPTPAAQAQGEGTPSQTMTAPASLTPAVKPDTPTVTTQPCDQAQFISDVTIPDGTKMAPGEAFTKTWRLRNLGSCTWDTRYALVFSSGDAFGAPAVINLPGSVPTNATVDLSVDMKAPTAAGDYISSWKLRNPQGETFGVVANQPFYAQISVVVPTPTINPRSTATRSASVTSVVYDFTTNLCQAEWRSQAVGSELPCPGLAGDSNGYVMKLESPSLETGAIETAPVLLSVPRSDGEKAITGTYAGIAIKSGYHFRATLGCLNQMHACSVIYQLNYAVGSEIKNLGEWSQAYDGSIQGIDVDLSSLAGKTVDIILVVLAGENSNQDQAVWIFPRIMKQ